MADGKLVVVTIVVNGLNLTEGKDHKVSVTATNSIGTSEPVNGILSLAGPGMLILYLITRTVLHYH